MLSIAHLLSRLTAGIRRDPPKALWTHGRIELPAVEIRTLIARARSAVGAGHCIVLRLISFRGEILPTLERDYFGHDTTSSLISGGARLLSTAPASAPSGGRRRSAARHCTIDRAPHEASA
jgi:hypothetical protein